MPTEVINFRLGKQPLVKEKIIVLEEADGRKAVIFPMYREKHEIAHAEVAKTGEVLELTGKWGTDKKTGKPQFFVDKAFNAQIAKEEKVIEPVNINTGLPQVTSSFKLPKLKDIKAAMDANYWPGPLFPGDPYAVNPEVDFTESNKIKTFVVTDKIFYTDSIFVWQKDNPQVRQKIILTEKLREEYLKQHNIMALYTIHDLTDESEPYPENHHPEGLPTSF